MKRARTSLALVVLATAMWAALGSFNATVIESLEVTRRAVGLAALQGSAAAKDEARRSLTSSTPYRPFFRDVRDLGSYWKAMKAVGRHTPVPRVSWDGGEAVTAWPLFLVIGVQKGGSTNLRHHLLQHRMLAGSPAEVHFFDKVEIGSDTNEEMSKKEAAGLLQSYTGRLGRKGWTRQRGFTFDCTPRYIFDAQTPYRINRLMPHIRMVVLLRDPVERYMSEYHMYVCRGYGLETFHEPGRAQQYIDAAQAVYPGYNATCRGMYAPPEALAACEASANLAEPLNRGLYADQLQRYYSLFDSDQILVVDSTELFTDFIGALSRITTFVGLPAYQYQYDGSKQSPDMECSPEAEVRFAEMQREMAAAGDEKILRDFYRSHNQWLFDYILGRDLGWNDVLHGAEALEARHI